MPCSIVLYPSDDFSSIVFSSPSVNLVLEYPCRWGVVALLVLFTCFTFCAGYDVYLVGGCVRDLIMKKTPKDFDIITTADLRQVITQIKKDATMMKLNYWK